jgi:hypothetical protein
MNPVRFLGESIVGGSAATNPALFFFEFFKGGGERIPIYIYIMLGTRKPFVRGFYRGFEQGISARKKRRKAKARTKLSAQQAWQATGPHPARDQVAAETA